MTSDHCPAVRIDDKRWLAFSDSLLESEVAQDILEQVVVLVILGLPNGIAGGATTWCYYRRAEDSTVHAS